MQIGVPAVENRIARLIVVFFCCGYSLEGTTADTQLQTSDFEIIIAGCNRGIQQIVSDVQKSGNLQDTEFKKFDSEIRNVFLKFKFKQLQLK